MGYQNPANSRTFSRSLVVFIVLVILSAEAQEEVCQPRPMDIVFVIDGSRSVRPWHFKSTKDAVKDMVDQFEEIGPDSVQIGLIQYGSIVKQEFGLGEFQSKEEINEAIDGIKYMAAGTMTGSALRYLVSRTFTESQGARNRPGVGKIAVIITDGRAQDGRAVEVWQRKVKQAEIEVFAIGVGRHIRDEDLLMMASEPKESHKYYVKDFSLIQNLEIFLQTEICAPRPAYPVDLQLSHVTHTTMKASWSLDNPDLAPAVDHYVVTYYPADGSGEALQLQVNETEVVLTDLTPGTEYNVSVKSVGKAQESPTVSDKETTLSLGDTSVDITDVSATSFMVSWVPAGGDLLSSYKILTEKVLDDGSTEVLEEYTDEYMTHVPVMMVQNVEPGQKYRVTVTPVYGKLTGGSGSAETTTLNLEAPKVTVTDATFTTATVEWSDIGTEADSYTVRLFPSDTVEGEEEIIKEFPGNNTSFLFNNLQPGTRYTAVVVGYVGEGKEFASPEGSNEGTTLTPPTPDVDVTGVGIDTIDLSWTISGPTPGYFEYTCATDDPTQFVFYRAAFASERSAHIEEKLLIPSTEYQCNVVAVYVEDGTEVKSQPGTDTATTNGIPPPDVSVLDTSMTSLNGSWSTDVDVDQYLIDIVIKDTRPDAPGRLDSPSPNAKTVNPDELESTFQDLDPGTDYEIRVWGRVIRGEKVITSGVGYADGITKPAPPEKLRVSNVSPQLLEITFDSAKGRADAYEYKCVPVGTEPDDAPTFTTSAGDDRSASCENLEPGVQYIVMVRTVASGLRSTWVQTTTTAAVGPVMNFDLSEPTTHSLLATWEPPVGVDEVDHYLLRYRPSERSGEAVEVEVPGTDTRYILNGLSPATSYAAKIIPVVRSTSGPESRDFESTLRDVVSIEVTDTGYTTIDVSWPASLVPGVVYFLSWIRISEPQMPGIVFVNLTDTSSYHIDNLEPASRYNISIIYSYPSEDSNGSTTVGMTLPPPPGPVTFTEISETSFIVHWEPPEYKARPILYRIEFSYVDEEAVVIQRSIQTTDLQLKIEDVPPGTSVSISIYAVYEIGTSSSSDGTTRTLDPVYKTCSCKTYLDGQESLQKTLSSMMSVINELNTKIERLEEALVPPRIIEEEPIPEESGDEIIMPDIWPIDV